jgi:5-methylcytosine-specific restriction endonuclease McrA
MPQKYIEIYLDHFDLGEQSLISCEVCGRMGRVDGSNFDLHHIYGRGKGRDCIENLMCLCRNCHTSAHNSLIGKETLQEIHNKYLKRWM